MASLLALLLPCLYASEARPQEVSPASGSWRAEPMTVRWVVGDWGDACGPKPSGGGDPGGSVTVTESGGELSIAGGARPYSTAQCWAMHPGLSASSHSQGARSWKTTCRTAPNDPRQEILETTVTLAGDTLSFSERGQYQFSVQGQKCAASSGRWRTYRRSTERPEPDPAVAETPAPGASPTSRCARPGPPARIEVRPSRKLMRPGDQFRFRALVTDARGCPRKTPVDWALEPPVGWAALEAGTLRVGSDAGDASLEVVATAASQSVRARVEVVSSERYAALLESGAFNADGASDEAAMAVITSGAIGAQQAEQAARPPRKWAFVTLVSGIALLLAALGAWLLHRANRSRRAAGAGAGSSPGGLGATVVFDGERPAGGDGSGHDATRLEPIASERGAGTRAAAAAVPPETRVRWVCPACGTLYEAEDLDACPRDGARLLPVNA